MAAHVTQIAVGPTGVLYLLDSDGRVWASKSGLQSGYDKVHLPEGYDRVHLPEEVDPDRSPRKG